MSNFHAEYLLPTGVILMIVNGIVGIILAKTAQWIVSKSYPQISETLGPNNPLKRTPAMSFSFIKLIFLTLPEITVKSLLWIIFSLRIVYIVQFAILFGAIYYGMFLTHK